MVNGEEARIIAGGQSLGAMLNMRLVTTVDADRCEPHRCAREHRGCRENIVTGALVRQADALMDSRIRSRVPLLAMALPHVGHYQTRNRGTLGGSVAHADPSAEVAAGAGYARRRGRVARSDAAGGACARSISSARLWSPPANLTRCSPLCAGRPRNRMRYAFEEFSVRSGDYAIVAVACMVEDARGWRSRPRAPRLWRMRREPHR